MTRTVIPIRPLSALGREAVRLASELGWAVMPCPPRERRPLGRLVPNGVCDATTDLEVIQRWWSSEPNANLAIACRDQLVVVDVDMHGLSNGLGEWRGILAELGGEAALDNPYVATTPRGGLHLYFTAPPGLVLPSVDLTPSVEIKTGNHYLLCAPSTTPLGEYRWRGEPPMPGVPPPLLPQALRERIERAYDPPPQWEPVQAREATTTSPRGRAYLRTLAEALAVVKEPGRHQAILHAGLKIGSLSAGGELVLNEALALVEPVAVKLLENEPHRRGEAERTIRDGIRKGQNKPRLLPGSEPTDAGAPTPATVGEPAVPPKGPKWRSLQEGVLGALRPAGPRLTTGLHTLDEATRGGIPRGRVVVLAGAPGAAKTSFAVSLMDRWMRAGAVVVYLAADEPAEGIYTRLGQLANFDRDLLEAEGSEGERERAEYAGHCEGSLGVVLDPDDERDESTLEGAERVLWAVAADRKDLVRVLMVDSLQTVRCDEAELCETTRQKIDAKVGVCKRISRRGAVVVAISEMNRGGYRTGNREIDASALASGKESGGIEYGAALLLGLRSVKGEVGQVDLEVAKNRLGGSKPDLRVLQNFARCSFTEIAMPDREAEDDDARDAAAQQRDDRVRKRLLHVIATNAYTSASAVSRRAKGRHEVNMCTLRMLFDEGAIVKVNGVLKIAQTGQSNEQCGGDQ